ncbi:unnamed protein product [Polarella glacialis]|uniref:Uncharacterized protein n=1 Tax=Polarella glacialis TaxID=89957 RepID=A0A813FXL7_POLGL|nr:unnamed protein product [Polarella glacialis]
MCCILRSSGNTDILQAWIAECGRRCTNVLPTTLNITQRELCKVARRRCYCVRLFFSTQQMATCVCPLSKQDKPFVAFCVGTRIEKCVCPLCKEGNMFVAILPKPDLQNKCLPAFARGETNKFVCDDDDDGDDHDHDNDDGDDNDDHDDDDDNDDDAKNNHDDNEDHDDDDTKTTTKKKDDDNDNNNDNNTKTTTTTTKITTITTTTTKQTTNTKMYTCATGASTP